MAKRALFLLFLGAAACDPNVVDAVREPPPPEVPVQMPPANPLASSLLHRYSFNGLGDVALDSIGAAPGPIVGAELTGTGSLTLAGEHSLEYVNLPNGIISGLSNATFEAWLVWNDSPYSWQRIFDFGNSSGGEDTATLIPGTTDGTYSGTSYLFLTTSAAADSARGLPACLRVAYAQRGVLDEDVCYGPQAFPKNVPTHVAVVIDSSAQTMTLYQDGKRVNEEDCPLSRPLSAIDDVNNWLGRSNFTADHELGADYDEFRIYNAALSAEQIADSFKFGPDAKP
jgi:hypothetical protein